MNYSPVNQEGLLGLVQALKNGMDPNTAYTVFQNIQQGQAQQIANRQDRMTQLASVLMNAAQAGTTYAGSEALMNAMPGPAGPAAQNMLSGLYPTDQIPVPTPQSKAQEYAQLQPSAAPTQPSPNALSPAYSPPAPPMPSITEQLALESARQQAATEADWAMVQVQAAKAKAEGLTVDEFMAKYGKNPDYAAVFVSDKDMLKAILQNTFGQIAYETAGGPSVAT